MGSGVMPLAMATRPSKAARDPAIPDLGPGSRWSSAAPDTDPGPSPAGLVGGKRVVWVFLEEACRPGFRRNWRCACRRGGTRVPPEMGPGLRRGTRAPDGAPDWSGLAGSLAFGGTLFRLSPRRNKGSAG